MNDLLLSSCGRDLSPVADAVAGVERDQQKRFAFHREVEVLLPLIERAVGHAVGRPF